MIGCRKLALLPGKRHQLPGIASASSRAIPASAASTLASDSGCTALRAQSRNFASNWASLSGFFGEPIGSAASTVTARPSVLVHSDAQRPFSAGFVRPLRVSVGQGQHRGITEAIHFGDADLAVDQAVATRNG